MYNEAAKGSAEAFYELGRQTTKSTGDIEVFNCGFLKYLERVSELGHARATYMLASSSQNEEERFNLIDLAAEQGDWEAAFSKTIKDTCTIS